MWFLSSSANILYELSTKREDTEYLNQKPKFELEKLAESNPLKKAFFNFFLPTKVHWN
jgi:hypothetical protein